MFKSLSARLRAGILAMVAAFAVFGTVSVLGVVLSARDVSRIIDDSGPTVAAVDRMERSILRQDLLVTQYVARPDRALLVDLTAERRYFGEASAELSRLQRGRFPLDQNLLSEYRQYVDVQDACVAAIDSSLAIGPSSGAMGVMAARLATAQRNLADSYATIVASFQRLVRQPALDSLGEARERASSAAWRSVVVFAALTFVAVLVGLLVGSLIMREIRGPVARLSAAMAAIASGDRGARLPVDGVTEFQEIASGFNDMAERLEDAEQGLRRSYEGQRKILDEIPVGFLTMGSDYRIDPEYSTATERILGRSGVAGVSFPELICPSGGAGAAELARYLRQLFENTTADKDFLDEINPVRTLELPGPEGSEPRTIAIGFDRLREDDGKVSSVLVTIEDRTEVIEAGRALEEERRSHKRDADSIQAILAIGPGPLKDFFSETRDMIGRIRGLLGALDEQQSVHACFRSLHSIKGSAGSFGIDAIAMTAHEAEDIFARLREEGRPPTTQELVRINVLLGTIGEELDAFEALVERLKSTLLRLEELDAKGEKASELEEFSESLSAMIGQLSKSLAKPIGLSLDIGVESLPHLRELRTVIIHLVRNAADHGLEDEYERLFQGKPKAGTIKLSVKAKDEARSAYLVEIEDDGQGINFDRIAETAVAKGLIAKGAAVPAKQQLLSMLFQPGFSTKERVDEISGRGVGLDLVLDTVRSLGGSITVASSRGKGTRFSVTVPA